MASKSAAAVDECAAELVLSAATNMRDIVNELAHVKIHRKRHTVVKLHSPAKVKVVSKPLQVHEQARRQHSKQWPVETNMSCIKWALYLFLIIWFRDVVCTQHLWVLGCKTPSQTQLLAPF